MLLACVIPLLQGLIFTEVEQGNDDDLLFAVEPKAHEEAVSLSFVFSARLCGGHPTASRHIVCLLPLCSSLLPPCGTDVGLPPSIVKS